MQKQTIFALASAPGKAGISVIRVSGPNTAEVIKTISPTNAEKILSNPRIAVRSFLTNPANGETLDDALVIWFASPNSFTGEDVAELHIHGSRAVQQAIFDVLVTIDGVRLAEPGEYSRRAFENNKMDLTKAEGLADLIDAETQAQRKVALRQMGGELYKLYEEWRTSLTHSLAHVEAYIDFSEAEEDIPDDVTNSIYESSKELKENIHKHLDDGHRGERLRDGFEIAIIGAPNAGKSSLLNKIIQRDIAIVSTTAGTTRDVIEASLDLGGYPVIIADTAGLRETNEEIESEGIKRALKRAEDADLKIAVVDGNNWPNVDKLTQKQIDKNTIVVLNKADLHVFENGNNVEGAKPIIISAKTGNGVGKLIDHITNTVMEKMEVGVSPVLTRTRHRVALEECAEALERATFAKEHISNETELAAEDIRLAARCLGRITGKIEVEELLDVIFSNFCIGK
ncbi:MAG: tRNA uridine-5-carboxymethylaminomethyl(34) synthesis GTPase MnmE [Alphaproteobacteria bacterium]|nr:tRNA uridine-5-carboxymethylaminomethyl(34) synthesis GTPase MnmE [Alphaproteobacteria bacterium]